MLLLQSCSAMVRQAFNECASGIDGAMNQCLDVMGALGTVYHQARDVLDRINPDRWASARQQHLYKRQSEKDLPRPDGSVTTCLSVSSPLYLVYFFLFSLFSLHSPSFKILFTFIIYRDFSLNSLSYLTIIVVCQRQSDHCSERPQQPTDLPLVWDLLLHMAITRASRDQPTYFPDHFGQNPTDEGTKLPKIEWNGGGINPTVPSLPIVINNLGNFIPFYLLAK